jgi:hypothetical protein
VSTSDHYRRFGRLSTCSDIAAVLENLDTAFYKAVLAKFQPKDYIDAGFKSSDIPTTELSIVEREEAKHAKILEVCIDSLQWFISL